MLAERSQEAVLASVLSSLFLQKQDDASCKDKTGAADCDRYPHLICPHTYMQSAVCSYLQQLVVPATRSL